MDDNETHEETDLTERGPAYLADTLVDLLPSRNIKHHQVLDIVTGDNQVGQQLRRRGFTLIDALVFSQPKSCSMIDDKTYSQVHLWKYETEPLGIADDEYDSITAFELFNLGNVPFSIFTEMVRIVKKGGYICFVAQKINASQTNQNNKIKETHLASCVKKIQVAQAWELISKDEKPNCFLGQDGFIYVFKVVIHGTVTIV